MRVNLLSRALNAHSVERERTETVLDLMLSPKEFFRKRKDSATGVCFGCGNQHNGLSFHPYYHPFKERVQGGYFCHTCLTSDSDVIRLIRVAVNLDMLKPNEKKTT